MNQESSPATSPERARDALLTALAYAVFAALWILVSDWVVGWLFSEPAYAELANTLKGWLFVAVTALLLYSLLRRRLRGRVAPNPAAGRRVTAVWPIVVIVLVILAVTAGGVISTLGHRRHAEEIRLHAIADLKASQIGDWLEERLGDARFIQLSPFLGEQYERWQGRGDGAAGQRLTGRLAQLRDHQGLGAVSLLDPAGGRLWSTDRAPRDLAPPLRAALDGVRDGEVRRVGPYLDAAGRSRLDFLVPLNVAGGAPPVVVLHVDPDAWLYPMLQSWPVPSASGETLLLRRDGDQVQFINDLRHRKGAAVSFHLPLANHDMLSAQALAGRSQTVQTLTGVDYRGVPVLGMVRAIPGTDWHLVAKVDRAEVNVEAVVSAAWIGLTGVLALLIALTSLALLRQRQRLALAERGRRAETERARALNLLGAFAESSDDAIFAKDLEGRYLLVNRAASLFLGKPVEAVLGRDDRDLFPPDQALTLMEFNRQIIRENRTLTREEVLDTPGGRRVFLATKGPLRDEQERIIGTFGVSRDITESRQAEDRLADQMRRFRLLLDTSRDGIVIIDQDHRVVEANQRFADMLGYAPEELARLHTWDFESLRGEAEIRSDFPDLARTRRVFETRHRRKDGSEYDVEISASGAVWGGRSLVLCICRDITERKQADEALRENEARWIMAIDSAGHGVWDWDRATGKVFYSPNWKSMLGYAEEEIGDSLEEWSARVHPEDLARCQAELERHFRAEAHVYLCEHRMRCKDGHYLWILDQGRAVARDAQGAPVRMIGTHTDISHTKAAEEDLRRKTTELAERNAELERFNRATVGRELDMIALKRQVNDLARELGRPAPYHVPFADGPGGAQTP